ncbi:MAG TPA: hypothetical protein VFK18_00925, partial [Luteimonas sp.]|nr:hypothetical protein [Luteimonas sp.]
AEAEERRLAARDLADALGLPVGNAVDFWTEASLFSRAGMTALVYGPGDIAQAEERRLAARDLADALQLPVGNAVDFWTEASLFSRAGMTAIVYGPGDIAQAHSADEWVSLGQLRRYSESVARIIS